MMDALRGAACSDCLEAASLSELLGLDDETRSWIRGGLLLVEARLEDSSW